MSTGEYEWKHYIWRLGYLDARQIRLVLEGICNCKMLLEQGPHFIPKKGQHSLRMTQCYLRHKGVGEGKIL